METENSTEKIITNTPTAGNPEENKLDIQKDDGREVSEKVKFVNISENGSELDRDHEQDCAGKEMCDLETQEKGERMEIKVENHPEGTNLDSKFHEGTNEATGDTLGEEKEADPVFDGTEVSGQEANRSNTNLETEGPAWPGKAMALKNLVKAKSAIAVTTFLRRLSGKKDNLGQDIPFDENKEGSDPPKESGPPKDDEKREISQKPAEKSGWNPLSYINIARDVDIESKADPRKEMIEASAQLIVMKGRILLYTRLGCQDCREVRLLLRRRKLRYVEINIDVYPSRKLELEKIAGSSAVPKVVFNEILIGGLNELKDVDVSGKLDEKIDYLINEAPPFEAPLLPLSGEDDVSCSGALDELALIVRKMKQAIIIKDRFCKMRRFTNCFVGSEAVDFLSEDQYLERADAVEFARKLASNLFFQHVLGENLFEDGNHFYRFLDDDPIVSSQCHNIPRGIIDVKPKPVTEIASRLRFLSYAIIEAYTSDNGKHVDYISIHGSEEFARYLRIIQELHRVELQGLSREEKLAFFINLYNMMAIHAILVWGYPVGALERRKMFGDFKYVIGGCTYSLSAIQNGILRGNQRPPYNIMKPFGAQDIRSNVAFSYPEPLIHFALVCGNRSGPALRCFSPGSIDKELMEASQNFLRGGGLTVDFSEKVAYVSKILKWFSVDFGKNEVEVLKHASNYLKPTDAEPLLELLSDTRLKVIYQPYDWGLNY